MKQNKHKITAIFSVLLLTLILGLCGCGKDTSDITEARRSMENKAAKELRDQFEDKSVTEIVIDEDVTVMGCLVVNGNKTISGNGTITLDTAAKAGIYQDISIFNDAEAITEEDFVQMMESSVLYVSKGSELTVAGEIVINSNQVGNGIVVAQGGNVVVSEKASFTGGYYSNLYNQGTVTLEGGSFADADGYNIINAGTLKVTNGSMDGANGEGNIYNLGELEVSGGTVTKAARNNVYVADGTAVFNGGTISNAKNANVFIAAAGKAEVLDGATIQSGTTGIINYGSLELNKAKVERNFTNLQNYATANIKESSIASSSIDNVINEESGTMKFINSDVTSSGAKAIVNNKGEISFDTLSVRRASSNAIYNNGGTITGKDIVIYGAAGTAIDNIDAIDGTAGNMEIKGVEIQTGSGINVVQESCGKMELSDAVIGITSVTSVKLVSGTLVLNNIEVQGTTATGAGVWTVGGKLEINDSTIKSTKGRGMALAAGEITGKNIVFEDIINTGIDVMRHDNGYSSAKVELDNVSFSGGDRDNIATTAANADITINGGKFGKTLGNNVRSREGQITLNDVEILGNELGTDGNTSYHGVYLAGGTVTLNDCVIRDPLSCAIRNKGGNLYATNLKTYNTPAAAITNAFNDDKVTYGNITIKGLKVYDGALGAIRNDCTGVFSVTDGYLTKSEANIVMVTDGKMVLKDVEVFGSINPEGTSYHNAYVKDGTLEMTDVVLQDSASAGIRQAAGMVVCDNVTIKNATTNNVNISGGTITLKNSTLEVSKRTSVNTSTGASVTLTNTKVNGAGDLNGNNVGCVYIAPGATATVNGGTVIKGSATRTGITNEGGTLYVDGATITGNAQRGITVSRKTVTDKTTKESTLYIPKATIKNALISNNGDGTVSGGGIYSEGVVSVSDSTISGNKAHTGGGINCGTNSDITLNNVTIKNNEAVVYKTNAGNGGGVHVSGSSKLTVSGGKIVSNTAEGNGNGIRANSNDFYMYDSAVVDKNNNVYLENGITIKTKANGIGNTANNPLNVVCTDSTMGTYVVVSDSTEEAKRASARVACYDTNGALLDVCAFEESVVIGKEGEVIWTARVQNSDGTYTKYLTLQEAINAVPTSGVQTRVELLKDVTLSSAIDIAENGNRNILLTDDGNGPYTITRGFTKGTMIILRTGNQMTLEGSSKDDNAPSLIFDGAGLTAGNDQAIIKVGTNSTKNYHSTLTLNAGVQMTNNKSTSAGSAMRIYGTLIMNGGKIDNNGSTVEAGGISVYDNAKVTINGGTITGNKAGSSGAAICNIASKNVGGAATITINGGTIINNEATEQGGAIFMHSNGTLIMNGGTITGNTAGKKGGAVYLHKSGGLGTGVPIEPAVMVMTGGEISSNTAAQDGGGVYMVKANNSLTMTGGSISGNTAAGTGMDVYVQGTMSMAGDAYVGSVYLVAGKMIDLTASLSERENQTEVVPSSYVEGTKVLDGAATIVAENYQYFKAPAGTGVKIDTAGCLVSTGEIVEYEAQILQADGSYVGYMTLADALAAVPTDGTQTKVEIMKNITLTAALDIPQDKNRNILLTDDGNGPYTITRNFGGAQMIILRTGNQLTLEGSNKDDQNPSLIIDGAEWATAGSQQMMMVGTSITNKNATLTLNAGVTLKNNNCTGGGGAILVFGKVYMNGGVINNNESTGDNGGAIFIKSTGSMEMTGGTISNNHCTSKNSSGNSNKDGGAIYTEAGGSLTMSGGNITGNGAQAGGAVLTYGSMTMTGGTISNNTARTNGGAIFVHASGTLNMSAGTINGNSAQAGGAIYLHRNNTGAGKMEMSGGTINGNQASGNGGGVGMAHAENSLTMTGGSISANTATGLGKDIYVPGTLNMAGKAYAENVYLVAGKMINLTASLSERETLMKVALPSYAADIQVLGGDATIVAANCKYFTTSEEGYKINSEGKLEAQSQVLTMLRSMVMSILQ